MKKKLSGLGRETAARKERRSARRCPCCGGAPCKCDRACPCQELKTQTDGDELQDPACEDEMRFSFLRYAEPVA